MALLGASSDTVKCSHTTDLALFVFSVEASEGALLADSTGKMSLIKKKQGKYLQILSNLADICQIKFKSKRIIFGSSSNLQIFDRYLVMDYTKCRGQMTSLDCLSNDGKLISLLVYLPHL